MTRDTSQNAVEAAGRQDPTWRPVREKSADSLWLLLIVTLSLTVLLTRVILDFLGYPQVGNSTYHIAHVLWGGLLLFSAAALLITFRNRYILWCGAALSGVGAGLFIDEIGKFITQSNDYFFPLAFPIIYGFILTCVWLYFLMRRRRKRDARTLLYHVLEDLKQVLDHDLDPFERRELIRQLLEVDTAADQPVYGELAEALLTFVRSPSVPRVERPGFAMRWFRWLRYALASWPRLWIVKAFLIICFAILCLGTGLELVALGSLVRVERTISEVITTILVSSGATAYIIDSPAALSLVVLLLLSLSLMALVTALLLLVGKDHAGVRVGLLTLVFSLSIVNLFLVFFLQLGAVLIAGLQAALLVILLIYRWRLYALSRASAAA